MLKWNGKSRILASGGDIYIYIIEHIGYGKGDEPVESIPTWGGRELFF